MTRYPNPARALHQLGRHSSGAPGDEVAAPELWTIAGFAEATRAAFTGPFWPLGEFSDAQLRAFSAYLMTARLRDEREELLSRTWRGRLALRLNAATRSVRRSWEYWNSSTQRQVRHLSGFWETIGLLSASAAMMIGVWLAFLCSLPR